MTSMAAIATIRTAWRRMSEPEPRIDGDRSHRPNRQHLAEGRRIEIRIDGRPLDSVQEVVGVHTKREPLVAAEPDVADERRIELVAARSRDRVAHRVAER